jgi:hypothetical protein
LGEPDVGAAADPPSDESGWFRVFVVVARTSFLALGFAQTMIGTLPEC